MNNHLLKYCLFYILLFLCYQSFADKQAKIDSLQEQLKVSKDTLKIEILNTLCVEYLFVSPSKSLEYCLQALELLKEIPDKRRKAKILNNIGRAYIYSGNHEKSIEYFKKSLAIDKEIGFKEGISISYNNIGGVYSHIGKYSEAIEYYQKALLLNEEVNNIQGEAFCYNNIGVMYFYWEKYEEALEYYQKSLKIKLDIADRAGIANSYNNIGEVYYKLSEYNKAIDFYEKSIEIAKSIDDNNKLATALNFIGEIYQTWGKDEKALEYFNKSLNIHEKIEDKRGIAITNVSIGNAYKKNKKYNQAIKYYNISLEISKEIVFIQTILDNYINLSEAYSLIGNYKKSLDYYKQYAFLKDSVYNEKKHKQITEIQTKYETEKKEKEIELLTKDKALYQAEIKKQKILMFSFIFGFIIIFIFSVLLYKQFSQKKKANILLSEQNAEINKQKEEILTQTDNIVQQAYLLEQVNIELEKLSIVASETDNAVIIMDKKGNVEWINEGFTRLYGYNYNQLIDKKGSNIIDISSNSKIKEVLNDCITKKHTTTYQTCALSKTGYKIWSQTTLTPILDNNKNVTKLVAIDTDITKIKKAEEEIRMQRDEITDSILYAKRIQSAVLPPEELVAKNLSDYFILFKPRDIVSGDFYWMKKVDNYLIITVADCTGHGVPGAFMSMLGIALLNDIVRYKEITTASQALNELRNQLKAALRQSGKEGEAEDGIDMALCVIDFENMKMQFAGAMNPLYIIRNEKFTELKADKMPIGIYHTEKESFTNHNIDIQNGDIFYLFSDGFIDQFGGIENKRYTSKQFKNLLREIHNKPMPEQKAILHETLTNWMGNEEQIDDITVIGLKI